MIAVLLAASLSAHPMTAATQAAERNVAEQVALWNSGDLEGADPDRVRACQLGLRG